MVVAVLACANAAGAQTLNPRVVSFLPSADHNTLDGSGQPVVTSYELQFYQQGATASLSAVSLGKPTPGTDGNITVDFMAILGQPPVTGVTLEARVAAVGPAGRGESTPSNTFLFDGGTTGCSPVVSPTSQNVSSAGGSLTFNVAVATGCAWQATSGAGWITITSGATGSGNGSVTASVAANTTSTARTGSLLVAGQTLSITEDAGVAPNSAPSVSMTGPASGASYTAPATITLSANAADSDGSVSSVEFYANNTLVGTKNASPFTVTWTNVAAGSYTLTAAATDNLGARTVSTGVTVTVKAPNVAPTVQLTSPVSGTTFSAGAPIALTANAADSDGSVTAVRFYAGNNLIATVTASPFTYTWTNATAGTWAITAVATDNSSATTTSAAATITVKAPNAMPTVSLTSPTAGQSFPAGSRITLSANAADSDGTVSSVQFYANGSLVGTATASPYTVTWSNATAGTYSITAAATDNNNARTLSASVNISVLANAAPTVAVTSPASGASFTAPASITLAASAADSDGSVARVDFLVNGTLLGSATGSSPFTFTWNNVAAGSYTVTAVASDNAGASTTSAPVSITVVAAAPPPSTTGPDVAIVSPTAGSTFVAPVNVSIQASASEAGGAVSRVEFFVNGSLVGWTNAAPYAVLWSTRQPGNYTLTATATDANGNRKASAAVTVKVMKKAPKK